MKGGAGQLIIGEIQSIISGEDGVEYLPEPVMNYDFYRFLPQFSSRTARLPRILRVFRANFGCLPPRIQAFCQSA